MLERNFILDIDTLKELPKSLATLNAELTKRILPEHGNKWNYVRYEIWSDTGRIIVFPAHHDKPMGIEKERVAICCQELEDEYCKFDDDDIEEGSEEEEELEAHYERVTARIAAIVRKSCAQATFEAVLYDGDEPLDSNN